MEASAGLVTAGEAKKARIAQQARSATGAQGAATGAHSACRNAPSWTSEWGELRGRLHERHHHDWRYGDKDGNMAAYRVYRKRIHKGAPSGALSSTEHLRPGVSSPLDSIHWRLPVRCTLLAAASMLHFRGGRLAICGDSGWGRGKPETPLAVRFRPGMIWKR